MGTTATTPGPDHIAFIHTETPGPVKVAICLCGWRSNPHLTAITAIKDRDEHYRRARPTPVATEEV
jgi:hypothetical protein